MPLDGLPDLHDRTVPPQLPFGQFNGLAFIGEAPGINEVEKGIPFCGQAGNIFDAILRAAHIDRAQCFVSNVVSTKLEDNDLRTERIRRGTGWSEFWDNNVRRLQSELAAIKPTVVVPMGGTALLALAGTSSISAQRGNARMGAGLFAEYKLLPTWHPAAILRQWNLYNIAIGDIIHAYAEALRGPTLIWPERELIIAPTIDQVECFLAKWCTNAEQSPKMVGPLSCDIETGWGMVRGISFAPSSRRAMYVPFISLSDISRSYWHDFASEKRAWLACKAALESPAPKLGQNFANYDVVWLLTKMGIRPRNLCHDLRLLHKALHPELPAGLGFMGSAYSDQGAWKAWAKHGGSKLERGEKRDE